MRQDSDHLRDIVVALQNALRFAEGLDERAFLADPKTQAAVQYQLMVAGEAVKRLSEGFRLQHNHLAWSSIAGMRDVLVHAYHREAPDEVWRTLEKEIPPVLDYLTRVLEPEEAE